MENDDRLVSLRALAQSLRVPAKWLRSEAEAGRLPCLRAGRKFLFSVKAVERALLARAESLTAHSATPPDEESPARASTSAEPAQ